VTSAEGADEWLVVINDEEQYSIWAADRPVPDGWRAVGEQGSREACLSRIEELWTDMRPKSLRDRIAAAGER
jgi:MbtH protein